MCKNSASGIYVTNEFLINCSDDARLLRILTDDYISKVDEGVLKNSKVTKK